MQMTNSNSPLLLHLQLLGVRRSIKNFQPVSALAVSPTQAFCLCLVSLSIGLVTLCSCWLPCKPCVDFIKYFLRWPANLTVVSVQKIFLYLMAY